MTEIVSQIVRFVTSRNKKITSALTDLLVNQRHLLVKTTAAASKDLIFQ